jgi:peptidoglycan hydrolase CwlO-like protein
MMRNKRNKLSKVFSSTVLAALAVLISVASFALAGDTAAGLSTAKVSEDKPVIASTAAVVSAAPVLVSTAAVTASEPVSISTAAVVSEQVSDNKQIYDAITDLNYKIEYLKSGYNRTNADFEALRLAVRDLRNDYNDRISSLSDMDFSRVDKLEAESAQMRADIEQLKAEIAELKDKLGKSQK